MERDVQVPAQRWDSLKLKISQETLKKLIFHQILTSIKQIFPRSKLLLFQTPKHFSCEFFLISNGTQQDIEKVKYINN